jgi:hypothetical protein
MSRYLRLTLTPLRQTRHQNNLTHKKDKTQPRPQTERRPTAHLHRLLLTHHQHGPVLLTRLRTLLPPELLERGVLRVKPERKDLIVVRLYIVSYMDI